MFNYIDSYIYIYLNRDQSGQLKANAPYKNKCIYNKCLYKKRTYFSNGPIDIGSVHQSADSFRYVKFDKNYLLFCNF